MPMVLLYLIPYLVVGWDVLRKAVLGVKNRQPFDECFLMAVATVGAFALGEFAEGCAVHPVLPDRRAVPERGGGQKPPQHRRF